jgi:hypothetical protein
MWTRCEMICDASPGRSLLSGAVAAGRAIGGSRPRAGADMGGRRDAGMRRRRQRPLRGHELRDVFHLNVIRTYDFRIAPYW